MKSVTVGTKKNIWGIIVAIVTTYIICMLWPFNLSGLSILKFVLLNVVSIFLPGIAIFTLLDINLSRVGAFCVSYLLGYAFLIVEYFFAEIFDRKVSFTTVTVLVAIVSVIFLCRKNKNIRERIEIKEIDGEKICLFFLAIFMVLNVFAYAANYLGTDVVPVFRASRDMQYWVNNTVALKISWPADNLTMVGNSLNYHYFSNIPIAFLCEVYHIDVFTMSFPFYAFTKTIVLVGAVQFLLETIAPNRIVYVIGYILLVFSTGAETISRTTYVHHILLSPFGFDIGYAYGVMFVSFLLRQWNQEDINWKNLAGTILIWGMCVGAKAPAATVLIIIPAFLCLIWLTQRKVKLVLGYGIGILGEYLIICKYCVGMFKVLKGESTWHLQGFYTPDHYMFMGNAEDWDLIGRCFVIIGRKTAFLGLALRTLCMHPILVIGTVITIVWLVFLLKNKAVKLEKVYISVSLILSAVFGIVLWHVINAGGSSEMYFAMAAFIPMSVLIILALDLFYKTNGKVSYSESSIVFKGGLLLFVLLIQLGIFRFSWSAWNGVGAFRNANNGFWYIYDAHHGADYSGQIASGVRDTDVEALSWIRENADNEALVMTDKAIMTEKPAYYLYGIFCERQQYLEGTDMLVLAGDTVQSEIKRRTDLIRAVYNNELGAIELIKDEGIDYIVQTIDVTPDFEYDTEKMELVESTATMNIYRVK